MATGRVIKRNGKWAYVISLPYDPEKSRYPQKWRSGFETKKAAAEAMAKDLATLEPDSASKGTMSVAEYLESWLILSVQDRTAPRTLETYRHTVESFIVPYIGSIKLNNLSAAHIEAMYKKLGERIQPSSVHRAHRVLRTALNRAVKKGILNSSPMVRVEPPSAKTKHRDILDLVSVGRMVEYLRIHHPVSYVGVKIALATGLRRGELCGLKWSDFDQERRILRVVRSRQRRNGVDIVGAPKTSGSVRPVPIGADTADLLLSWLGKQQLHAAERQEVWSDDVYILRRLDAMVIDPMTLSRDFRKALKALDLPDMSFHDLRHLHATLLLESGVPMKVVSERLGHSSIILTANTYSHVTETMQADAVAKIENALKGM